MTQLDLGRALRLSTADYGPLADLVSGMRDSILAELRATILAEMTTCVTAALVDHAMPQVTVQPPAVSVAAPSVNVTNTMPGEDDAGEIDAMDRQTEILTRISAQLGKLLALAQKPVTTRIDRDSADRITQTTASR